MFDKSKKENGPILYKAFLISGNDDPEMQKNSVDVTRDAFFTDVKSALTDLFRWSPLIKPYLNVDKLAQLTGKQFSILGVRFSKKDKEMAKIISESRALGEPQVVLQLIDDKMQYKLEMNDYILTEIQIFVPEKNPDNIDILGFRMVPIIRGDDSDMIELDSHDALKAVPSQRGSTIGTF